MAGGGGRQITELGRLDSSMENRQYSLVFLGIMILSNKK